MQAIAIAGAVASAGPGGRGCATGAERASRSQ
jgi:hypothetical protein